jgi:RHS repeat-associated protein
VTVGSAAPATYHYNLQHELVGIDTDGVAGDEITYAYDYAGNRVAKTEGGTTTHYLVDANNPTGYAQVLEESATLEGSPTRTYVSGLQAISQTAGATGATIYLMSDGSGSTRFLTDSQGGVVEDGSNNPIRYNYDAYGTALNFTAEQAATALLYTGQMFDGGTNGYYLRARYYTPARGLFMSADSYSWSLGSPLTLARYGYAANNPIDYADPSGYLGQALGEFSNMLSYLGVYRSVVSAAARFALRYIQSTMFNVAMRMGAAGVFGGDVNAAVREGLLDWKGNTFGALLLGVGRGGMSKTAASWSRWESQAERDGSKLAWGVQQGEVAPYPSGGAQVGVSEGAGVTRVYGQVAYGSTDLSALAVEFRQGAGISAGRNISVIEFQTENGLNTITAASTRGVGHAERIAGASLQELGIQPSAVTRVYSELQPCNLPGGYCASFLQRTFPNAPVTWSFEYGMTIESRQAGLGALRATLEASQGSGH